MKNVNIYPTYFILIITFIFTFVHNITSIIQAFNNINNFTWNNIINPIAIEIVFFSVVFLILNVLSISKIILKITVCIILLISTIMLYFHWFINIYIDEWLVEAIVSTTAKEAVEFLNIYLILFVLIFAIIPIWFIIFKVHILPYDFKNNFVTNIKRKKYYILLFLGLILSTMTLEKNIWLDMPVKKYILASHLPASYIVAVVTYSKYSLTKKSDLIDITKKYNFVERNSILKQTPKNIILIIGESNRAKQQHYNGYYRDTNPFTAKNPNIINLHNMYSCGTLSSFSISCMLSKINRLDYNPNKVVSENNLISVFNSLNFETYFLSINSISDKESLLGNSFQYSKHKVQGKVLFQTKLSVSYDEELLPYLSNIKNDKSKKNKFIVFYLYTAHSDYSGRYPEKFNVFNGGKVKIDEYDNAVRYSDFMVSEIINTFKDENTIVLFVSDHGESFGENGYYMHGHKWDIKTNKQEVHVASQFYMSPKMQKFIPEKYKNVKSKEFANLSQDMVFSTLLDCIDVSSSIVDKKLSLCGNY